MPKRGNHTLEILSSSYSRKIESQTLVDGLFTPQKFLATCVYGINMAMSYPPCVYVYRS